MRTIWTIWFIAAVASFAGFEWYAVITNQMTLSAFVRNVTTHYVIQSAVLFVVGAIMLALHFWYNVKPNL